MDKNKLIKENLEYHIYNSKRLFKEQFSFLNLLKRELDEFNTTKCLTSSNVNIDKFKERKKNDLIELLGDTHLHSQMNNIIDELVNIREKSFQGYTEYQLINNLSETSLDMSKKESDFKLDLLFLEHDYEFDACFCGYEDSNYNFKLLSGYEYLKYDYNKELFNGNGSFDYTPFLRPILKFEENLGKEKVNMINESLGKFYYLDEIKKFFLLNGFLGIHLCLDNIGSKIRQLDIPMNDEVFIFGNEHDCEELNIYVL